MSRFLITRLGLTAVSLAGVVILSFALIHFIPGDPVDHMLGEQASVEDRDSLRRSLGLDRPLPEQFLRYLSNLAALDLGQSLVTRTPVADELWARYPATVELAVIAMLLAMTWGIPLGVWAAARRGGPADGASAAISLLAMSTPGIFLGPALIYVFALRLDWFPVSERTGWDSVILPAVSLALPLGAVLSRLTRAAVLEVLDEDFMRTARAKGVPPGRLYFKHALRNAMIPVTTILGLQMGALLTGTVITETIFDWPGVGTLLFQAIQRRDYPLVQGCVLMQASIYVTVNLMTDLAYGHFNPRARTADA